MKNKKEDYTPGCFKTKQYDINSGICLRCRKYVACGTEIKNQQKFIELSKLRYFELLKKKKGGKRNGKSIIKNKHQKRTR